jgi:hypothetical protein
MLIDYKVVSMKQNPNEKELKKGKRWPKIPWLTYSFYNYNGDGQLFYPGKNQFDLWPSIRLINIRDGIEDYEFASQIMKMKDKKSIKRKKWLIRFNNLILNEKLDKTDPIKLIKLKKDAIVLLEEYSRKFSI